MFPVICHIGHFPLHSYGLMLALAIVVVSWSLSRRAARAGIAPHIVNDLIFWVVIGGIIGARIFYIGLDARFFLANPLDMLMIWKGGLAWQGSLLAGFVCGVIFIRHKKLPLRLMLDLVAPHIALGQAIGRIGCFLQGCCYGKPAAWGLFFPVWGEKLVPVQLFMVAGQLAIYGALSVLSRRALRRGQIFIWYLMLASAERFTVEFFRADHLILAGGLSIFQYICVGIFIAATLLNIWLCRKDRSPCLPG
jgi:phosphatidylglycerol:prolipoprotein diacylglycerol transferase